MPEYTIRLGGTPVTKFETDKTLGESIGNTLADSKPQTFIDGGGTADKSRWQEQEHTREQLLEYKEIKESGGPIASVLKTKALLAFGTESEWDTESEDLTDWLDENFAGRDLLFIDIGEDGFTYPAVPLETVETKGGDFSHVECVEPWTITPQTDDKGDIVGYKQHVRVNGEMKTKPMKEEELAYIVLNKSCGRDKTGVSELEQNRSEIERFYDNQESIKNSSQLHGFPQRHIKVGREGAAPPNDNELRRLRSRFSKKWNELTMFVTGRDVEMDTLEASEFDYQNLTESDIKVLMWAFLLPQEIANTGSDGLGSGTPADLRWKALELSLNAYQKRLATQFISQIARPVVEEYSPHDPDDINGLEFEPLESDIDERIERAMNMEDYLTTDEIREAGNYEPVEDEEVGESYDSPGEEESQDDPMSGLFNSDGSRNMADPMINGHDLNPGTGEGVCENTGKAIEAETMGDLEEDCPHCGEPLSAFAETELSDGGSGNSNRCGGLHLSEHVPDGLPEWERSLIELQTNIWDGDADRALVGFTESGLPEFAKANIRQAIMSGAMFTDFEDIPSSELMELRQVFADSLTDDGWTVDEMRDELMDFEPDLSQSEAESIARTETAAISNKAREAGYEEKGQAQDTFYWTGNLDGRQTAACEWLIETTNPHHGGTPVPMEELKQLIEEAPEHDPDMADELARPDSFVVHPQERKTFVRHIE